MEELGALLLPFIEGDGIKPPPLNEWVERSRGPKLNDPRLQKRMKKAPFRAELEARLAAIARMEEEAAKSDVADGKTNTEQPAEDDASPN